MEKKKRSRGRKASKPSLSLTLQQLKAVDTRVVDRLFSAGFPDSENTVIDLFSEMQNASDYLDLTTRFGEIKWKTLILTFEPLVLFSSTTSDCACGYLGVRQGIFESSPAPRSAEAVVTLPGSVPVNNHKGFSHVTSILSTGFFSSSMTNTSDSIVPKVYGFLGWSIPASTHTLNGQLRIRLIVDVRDRLDAFQSIE